jgi:hypothetical protein
MRRLAVYAAPRPGTAWHDLAAAWLGRSPELGEGPPGPGPLDGAPADVTAEAAAYGFHGTLRSPFVPAPGVTPAEVTRSVGELAASSGPVHPTLRIGLLAGFPAFLPEDDAGLGELATACVRVGDGLAAPPGPEELARRRRAGLTPRQEALLTRWGYPYVMEEFRFHMTLGRRLAADEVEPVLAAARSHFVDVDGSAFPLDDLVVFEQVDGGPFRVRSRHALGVVDR